MTRTKFIMKWLGTNKPYDQYHRDEMLEDLDKVIAYAKQAVKNCNTPAVSKSEGLQGEATLIDFFSWLKLKGYLRSNVYAKDIIDLYKSINGC